MLEGKKLSCAREEATIFCELSFAINKGERLGIKGANGSGKSTFLRLLAGLLPIKTGQLFWKGEEISKTNLSHYQQNLLYMGHKLGLHPEIFVKDQLNLWHMLYKIPKRSMEQGLEQWGLGMVKNKKISHLSQGQQKRLALSRCSWLKRSLWILDEPEAALDKEGQDYLADILHKHLSAGGLVVQATHHSASSSLEIML